jgi:hypothetical protein
VLAGLASIFGAIQPANIMTARFRFTLPPLAISVIEDKKILHGKFYPESTPAFWRPPATSGRKTVR